MNGALDPEYVAARRVLLDALEGLQAHRQAIVLVGAQAIYLRVGTGDLAIAPFTTDGDLALNPNILEDEPILAEALRDAGFSLAVVPGTWSRADVQIDLLVPSSLSGAGRRSARLGVHGTEVARKAIGLEAAIVDSGVMRLTALDKSDTREFDVAVAGLSGLLVAKLHKLAERQQTPDRWAPKDGLDVLRILQGADLRSVAATLSDLERHAVAGEVTRQSRALLRELFGTRKGHGVVMAVLATGGVEDEATIAASCEVLARQLLTMWDSSRQV